jgi:23S rRNA pseudouridine1911/1915/1917 synthase
MTESLSETVPASLHGQRLDRVVALIADISRAATLALLEGGGVRVDGADMRAGKVKVREGQLIEIDQSKLPTPQLPVADARVPIDLIHVDDDLLVINKRAGVIVHPGAGNPDSTLVNGLLAAFPEIASVGEPMRPGIVHRLDAGTTGLMLVARTPRAYEALVGMLARREVSRRYHALAWGTFERDRGIIDAPIGRDHRDPTKMAVVVDGKHARTHYEVQRAFVTPQPCVLVTCSLETGRTHQIRVHLTSIGHPVVGDAVYGGARSVLSAPRPMLHAFALGFVHPFTSEHVEFDAPLPSDFAEVLERCAQ